MRIPFHRASPRVALGVTLIIVLVVPLSPLRSLGQPTTPSWLWTEEESSGPITFRHEFRLSRLPDDFTLTVTADFAAVDVLVNEMPAGEIEAFDPVTELAIADLLSGDAVNTIELVARSVAGPPAVAAMMRFTNEEGSVVQLGTSAADWDGPALIEKGPVLPTRWAPSHLPDIAPSAEYNQWKEALEDAAAKSLSPLPRGFTLRKIHEATPEQGSWVSLVLDGKGRLIVGMEDRGLLRITLSEDSAGVREIEVINEDLEECRGLAFRGEVLYANANDSKGLYRLRDTTGDDTYDEVILLQETTGSVGHGRNDLVRGPDGTIHAIHGDSVDLPDRSSPRFPPEPGRPSPLGHWLSIGASDDEWIIRAGGLRNPYGIDFNADGEAFTYDADNEGDVGLPFYRPSRINHLVEGGNYGWHQRPGNTRSLPVYAPDSLPTTFDVGRGSPTGVKFGTMGRHESEPGGTLFALDWAYGRILAIDLVPRGGSYHASGTVFLEGRPLNVTDLDFDSEGAMLFITGGRKTRSALYRVTRDTQEAVDENAPTAQQRERNLFSEKQRALRRSLAGEEGPIEPGSDSWDHLGNPDPWVRHAARLRLEKRPVEEWRSQIPETKPGLARLTAQLALARRGNDEDRRNAARELVKLPSDTWSRTEKLTYLRIGELCRPALGEDPVPNAPERDPANAIAETALSWITSSETPVSREAIRLLADLDRPETIPSSLALLATSKTQSDQLFYLEMLSRVTRGWSRENRTRFFQSMALAHRASRGDRFMPPFFAAMKENALDAVPEEEQSEWAALLEAPAPEQTEEMPPREFVRNWTMADFDEGDFSGKTSPSHAVGRSLFRAGLCHRCHAFGEEGIPVGPDLSQVGSRFSIDSLLQSILEPSAVVSEVYQNVSLELTDGRFVTGRLVGDDFRRSLLYLSTNPFDPEDLTTIPKKEVKRMAPSDASPMPPALLSGLRKEEVVSLILWLRRGPSPGTG